MRQYIILPILIFITTTTALYAQTNTGGFGKYALGNPDFNYLGQLQNFSFASRPGAATELIGYAFIPPDATLERTVSFQAQTKMGFRNYPYWNKGASYNPGTLWMNGIPTLMNPRQTQIADPQFVATNISNKYRWNKGASYNPDTLIWMNGIPTLSGMDPRTRRIIVDPQFFTTDISNKDGLMALINVALTLYIDHRRWKDYKSFYLCPKTSH